MAEERNRNMERGGHNGRLPTTHPRRIQMRDVKMWHRERVQQERTGDRTSRCPCTLCLFGRPLLRSTQAKHLRDYGRHPKKRLPLEVNYSLFVNVTLVSFGSGSVIAVSSCRCSMEPVCADESPNE